MPPREVPVKFMIHKKILRNLAQESINKLGFGFFTQGMFFGQEYLEEHFQTCM